MLVPFIHRENILEAIVTHFLSPFEQATSMAMIWLYLRMKHSLIDAQTLEVDHCLKHLKKFKQWSKSHHSLLWGVVFWDLRMVCVVTEEVVQPFNLFLEVRLQEEKVQIRSVNVSELKSFIFEDHTFTFRCKWNMPAWVHTPQSGQTWGKSIPGS